MNESLCWAKMNISSFQIKLNGSLCQANSSERSVDLRVKAPAALILLLTRKRIRTNLHGHNRARIR